MSDQRGGDRAPGETSGGRLARPPSDRYRTSGPEAVAEEPGRRPWVVAVGIAVVGAVVITALGLVDLSLGLVAVAIGVGWLIGIAARAGRARPEAVTGVASRRAQRRVDPDAGRRTIVAAALAVASIVAGLFGIWLWSRLEGGVLGPFDYFADRFDLLALVLPVVAGVAAAIRAR